MITGLHRGSNKNFNAEQQEQQFKVGALSEIICYFTEEIYIGFKKYKKKKHPISVAFSYNFGKAFTVLPRVEKIVMVAEDAKPKVELDFEKYILLNYPQLVFTRGDVFSPDCPSIDIATDGNFTCSWMGLPESVFNRATDLVTLLVWNAKEKKSLHYRCMAPRAALSFTAQLPNEWMGHELHGYLFCSTADGKNVGESVYLPIVLGL